MAERYDPFKDETLGTPAEPPLLKKKRKPPTKIDWKRVAAQIAEGEKPCDIAAGLGIQEERIWRHLHKSLRFQTDLERSLTRLRVLSQISFGIAGPAAAVAHLSKGVDGETARWLAANTGVAAAAADDAAGKINLVERLRAVGRRQKPGQTPESVGTPANTSEHE